MQPMTSTKLQETLKNIKLPYLNQDVVSSGWLQSSQIDHTIISLDLKFGFPLSPSLQTEFQSFLQQQLREHGAEQVRLSFNCQIRSHAGTAGIPPIPGVKNIIAVASGKGGVGKSTTAVNLALALLSQGARVGLLDADIYGPNQPHMLGTKKRPQIHENKTIEPLMAHGLQSMSIGYLVDESTPMVWRGPMISAALQQLIRDTCWDNLDYLFVDLPPGTGDIQLTLAKKVPVTGAVMVTTPQDIALLDVRKGLEMFRKVDVQVLGVIENMSHHLCTQCGHVEALFGEGGGRRLADDFDLPLLGQLGLSLNIREDSDRGVPTVAADPDGAIAKQYIQIALNLAVRLASLKINYAAKFPKVTVE